MKIPSMLLKRMYTFGTLKNDSEGVRFSLKNRLSDATLTEICEVAIDGKAIDLKQITIQLEDGTRIKAPKISPEKPIEFPLRKVVHLRISGENLEKGKHALTLKFNSDFGNLAFYSQRRPVFQTKRPAYHSGKPRKRLFQKRH